MMWNGAADMLAACIVCPGFHVELGDGSMVNDDEPLHASASLAAAAVTVADWLAIGAAWLRGWVLWDGRLAAYVFWS